MQPTRSFALDGRTLLSNDSERPSGGVVGAVLLLSFAILLLQSFTAEWTQPVYDSVGYARIGLVLHDTGIFTNGEADGGPGMFFAPLYPAFIAAVAFLDGGFEELLRCAVTEPGDCALSGLASLVALQALLAGVCALLVFLTTWRLTRSPATAWLAWLICALSGVFAEYTHLLLTEAFAFLFFLWFNYLAVRLVTLEREARPTDLLLLGAALGAAALSRPAFLYLGYVSGLALLLAPMLMRTTGTRAKALLGGGAAAAWFAAGVAILVLPWMIRNAILLDSFKLSEGYAGFILVQRVAYNMMSWSEWGVSFIYWLPDFGDSLAKALFPEELYRRLGWNDPTTFYQVGNNALRDQTMREAGDQGYVGYLLREYVLGDIVKHVAVTLTIAIRGIWVGKYASLIGLLLAPAAIWIMARRGRLLVTAVAAAPGLFMLGLHAFVTVNVVRYNEPLILLFAIAIAVVAAALAQHSLARPREAPWPSSS